MKIKKIATLICIVVLMVILSVSLFASGNSHTLTFGQVAQMYDIENEKDQIDPNGGYYHDYQKAFEARGLTFSNVKTLQNKGYSYKQILSMSYDDYKSILPNSLGRITIMAAPTGYVKVTNVGGAATEYYHKNTGMIAGDFYTKNNGAWIESQIEDFIYDVYGSLSNMVYMNYLWGEWDDVELTHPGVDMYKSGSSPGIYATHYGVVTTDQTDGRVGIYNSVTGVTYFYHHLTNIKVSINDFVEEGTLLGYEGNHLHFEVANGKTKYMKEASPNGLSSTNPYSHMTF